MSVVTVLLALAAWTAISAFVGAVVGRVMASNLELREGHALVTTRHHRPDADRTPEWTSSPA
jgi:hypothetical protein